MARQINENAWVYIIDQEYQIVYSNDDTKRRIGETGAGARCYQTICGEGSPCGQCPLRPENHGRSILFDRLHNEWVNVSAAPIEWPGAGLCHMILCSMVREHGQGGPCWEDRADAHCGRFAHGLYGKQNFFRLAGEILAAAPQDTAWCVAAFDLEQFKLFNEWYGREAGDALLADIAACLDRFQRENDGLAGYFGDDDFAVLLHDGEDGIRALRAAVRARIKEHYGKMNVLSAVGIYPITDRSEPVYKMYDRAKLACSAVKGSYTTRVRRFEPEMLEAMESEMLLLADIQEAFERREFTFYLQPKCNMRTGKIVGAEALARWNSANKGLIPPGVFVPFLEKSGLISELDTYIWEEVCRWQRSMLDRGRETVPVSVNISRIDICSVDVPSYFIGLIERYGLDPRLLELEITESAYAEDMGAVNEIVTRLREAGFRVLMDDFGSAYSSLNMLKDITIDVIKMDMRFLDLNSANADRGTDILETVCNMAHILGLGIIAEGVETEEQKDLLLKAGCSCGQGYYFHRPLAVDAFEAAAEPAGALEEKQFTEEPTELFYLTDLINKNMLSQNMLNNMLGAVAFYDVCDGQIKVLRYNEQYAAVLGNEGNAAETTMIFGEQLYAEEHEVIFQMFDDARRNRHTGAELDLRRRRPDGADMWLHLKAFFLYQRDGHAVYYSTVNDVTERHRSSETLRLLNNDMPGGYYRHRNNADGDFTHISQRFLDIFGFTREELREEFDDKFLNMVHPEDREGVRYTMASMSQTGGNYSKVCRMRTKNGYIFVLDQSRLVQSGGEEIFQGIILCDVDQYMWLNDDGRNIDVKDETTTLMPCGVFRSEADGAHRITYISNSMLHLMGYSRQDFEEKFHNSIEELVYEEDRDRVDREITEQIRHSNFTACEFRVELADGSLKWLYARGRLSIDSEGRRWFYVCVTDYDYLKQKYQVQDWRYLKYKSLVELPGVIVYDYDPGSDQLTLEVTGEDGQQETVVAGHYVRDIEKHGYVEEADVEEQRARFLEACGRPMRGITEFRGRFAGGAEHKSYRFHYISLADESGKVCRIVGSGEVIDE